MSWNGAMRWAVRVDSAAWSIRRVARSGSARTAMTSGRSWNTTSSSSPPMVMSHARCRSVALFLNAEYTVSGDTPAADATSAIVVRP